MQFADNYFTLTGRPLFVFGADSWQSFFAACEDPWTWSQELQAAGDIGLNLYEDLNYLRAGYRMTEGDWQSFLAMGQLAQRHGLIFMPGMLILQNVAVGDEVRTRKARSAASTPADFTSSPDCSITSTAITPFALRRK